MSAFPSANQLAAVAGLAPVPRDSGRISGNLRRPRRYDRRLLRALYLSAMISITNCPASRIYYDRNAEKVNATPKQSSPWHGAASTSCGPCCAITLPTNLFPSLRLLDNLIENPLAVKMTGPRAPPIFSPSGKGESRRHEGAGVPPLGRENFDGSVRVAKISRSHRSALAPPGVARRSPPTRIGRPEGESQ